MPRASRSGRVELGDPRKSIGGLLYCHNGPAPAVFRLGSEALESPDSGLDALLARRAGDAGAAKVGFRTRVLSVDGETSSMDYRLGAPWTAREEEGSHAAVIGAWGRGTPWPGRDSLARFLARRKKFFGWNRDFQGKHERVRRARSGSICFPGATAGSPRRGRAANLAACLRSAQAGRRGRSGS